MVLYAQNSDLSGRFHEIVRWSNIVPAMRKQGENWEIPSPPELKSSCFALQIRGCWLRHFICNACYSQLFVFHLMTVM
jgi:hypothetical protein